MTGKVLPIYFRKSSELVGNYDFVDIATGRARKTLYLNGGQVSGSPVFIMDTLAYESSGITTRISTAVAKVFDFDFDMKIERPLTLQGQGIVTFTIGLFNIGTTGTRNNMMVARLRKVDSSGAEHEIVMNTTTKYVHVGAVETFDIIFTLPLTIPNIIYNKGETMRLTIEIWNENVGAVESAMRWAGALGSTAVIDTWDTYDSNTEPYALTNNAGAVSNKFIIPIVINN